jgi:translin
MSLDNIFLELTGALDELDKLREIVLKISREMIRDSSVAIKHVHRREYDHYQMKIDSIIKQHLELKNNVNKNPGAFYKYLKVPEQEYVEAIALFSIISKKPLPLPSQISVDPLNYVLGLADVIGELRRYVLDNIRNSNIGDFNLILESMDEIYTQLFSLDYPSGLTQDLRHKTDIARSIIEKTRGDISLTIQMIDLKKCIESKINTN